MGMPGPKGDEELGKIEKDETQKWGNDPSTKAELQSVPGSQLKIAVKTTVTVLSEVETGVKAVDCGFPVPPECGCNEHTYKMTYKVDYEVQSYVVSPNIIGFSAPPNAKPTQGSDYTGSSYGSFTVKDEVIKVVMVDCPPGLFDLPKLPGNLASLAPDDAIARLAPTCVTARFGYLGTVIGAERTTIYRRERKDPPSEKPRGELTRIPTHDWAVRVDRHPSRGLSSIELATWNHIEDHIGSHLVKALGAARESRPIARKRES